VPTFCTAAASPVCHIVSALTKEGNITPFEAMEQVLQSMNCRIEPDTESSCGLPMRPIILRMTDAMTCCTPFMPRFADCSTIKPAFACLSGLMKKASRPLLLAAEPERRLSIPFVHEPYLLNYSAPPIEYCRWTVDIS
jgi:hypothetical protein